MGHCVHAGGRREATARAEQGVRDGALCARAAEGQPLQGLLTNWIRKAKYLGTTR
jgi:hypothetical protein